MGFYSVAYPNRLGREAAALIETSEDVEGNKGVRCFLDRAFQGCDHSLDREAEKMKGETKNARDECGA
jgi:hypothetical protein